MKNRDANVGLLGEDLVAQWLQNQDWQILQRRWHCRWGELDLIVQQPAHSQVQATLAFVEVKTRSSGNWDLGGLLAITPQKQQKLWHSARLFLAKHPDLAELPCRFDVALVSCQRLLPKVDLGKDYLSHDVSGCPKPITLGQPVVMNGYQLVIREYIPAAFGY